MDKALVGLAAWPNRFHFRLGEAAMGLMDILNGMQNGPRGGGHSGSTGMSPLTMALLALLAYKAVKSFGADSKPGTAPTSSAPTPAAPTPAAPTPATPTTTAPAGSPGGGLTAGLDDLLRGSAGGGGSAGLGGVLGGLLGGILGGGGGAAAGGGGLGGLLTGGLGDLLDQFHGAGKSDVATSWVGGGQNKSISAEDLAQVLTPDQIDFLTQRTGLSRQALLSGLSEQLPGLVDQLTPAGRLPTADEMNRVA
jgi:uncharacterized protein YidB (DUF937 family)